MKKFGIAIAAALLATTQIVPAFAQAAPTTVAEVAAGCAAGGSCEALTASFLGSVTVNDTIVRQLAAALAKASLNATAAQKASISSALSSLSSRASSPALQNQVASLSQSVTDGTVNTAAVDDTGAATGGPAASGPESNGPDGGDRGNNIQISPT